MRRRRGPDKGGRDFAAIGFLGGYRDEQNSRQSVSPISVLFIQINRTSKTCCWGKFNYHSFLGLSRHYGWLLSVSACLLQREAFLTMFSGSSSDLLFFPYVFCILYPFPTSDSFVSCTFYVFSLTLFLKLYSLSTTVINQLERIFFHY